MEQPPPTAPPPTSAAPPPVANHCYPDSIDSSPPSRNADSWDETLQKPAAGAKLRLMCSYGGHIVPRPHDKSLCYVAGETRIVVADRTSNLADLSTRLSKTLLGGGSFTLKYQLPNEDLDSLISVTTDEDLENMIEEYDRLAAAAANCTARKSSRLRLFLFPTKPDSGSSIGSLLDNSAKTEDWFLNALNGSARGFSESSSVNCLLGLDDAIAGNENSTVKDDSKTLTNSNGNKQGVQDVHSVPDSPMLENSSSFGSTSSCPSLANLPPIRVHSEDQKPSVGGIEEQLSQMSVGTTVQKQEDGNFLVVASPPPVLTAPAPGVAAFPGEYTNQLVGFSDDDRSDQGLPPIGYRKPPQPQQYTQQLPPSSQPKPSAGFDLASQDSVSSDNSATNPLSHQRAMVYQDQTVQNPSGNPNLNDPNPRVQVQQVQETGYVLQNHFDQQNQQQFNPQQQQQFIQVPAHYMHPHQAGAIPMGGYFLYPPHPQQQQQQQHQQQQLYYVSARPAQGYNMPIQQQQNYVESAPTPTIVSSRPQPPAPTSVAVPNHEMVYRTETGATTRLMQVSPPGQHQHQQQFVGYPHQIHHHPSQSMAPPPPPPHSTASAAATSTANYAYEYADPALSQMYYSQHMSQPQQPPPQPMAAPQYQTVTSPSAGMVAAQETSSQVPTESTKPPQK